jgi:hypothetical protein
MVDFGQNVEVLVDDLLLKSTAFNLAIVAIGKNILNPISQYKLFRDLIKSINPSNNLILPPKSTQLLNVHKSKYLLEK